MRVVITGQVGLDKKPFLNRVAAIAADQGHETTVYNIGQRMYAEAPDVAPGRILDLSLSRLNSIRRCVFKDVLAACASHAPGDAASHLLVNTHATFRWHHGLFYAFDYDQMEALAADLYVTLVDNVDRLHYRLVRDGHVDHTLKDLMVWREEEILATEMLSQIVRGHGCFYVMARSDSDSTAEAVARLFCRPRTSKAYLSFPMSHVKGSLELLKQIDDFRRQMKRYLTCFDPGDIDEKHLGEMALRAAEAGHRTVRAGPADRRAVMDTNQLIDIIPDIDGQIYARDFKLIDQADMIVSLIPVLGDGRPGLSSGVERELQHAHEATKEVFVIWIPREDPSPFVTETATRVFRSTTEAVQFLLDNDYTDSPPAGALFA